MKNDPKLEQYLMKLDKALGQISVIDRSDIITEIKSHILDAKEREPEREIGQILSALGEPENVANRYLMEKGIKPGKPSRTPVFKWLVIGFLGTFAIIALSFLALIYHFTPILKVDDAGSKVSVFGGAIEIDDKNDRVFINGLSISSSRNRVRGSMELNKKELDLIDAEFGTGKVEFNAIKGSQIIEWDCHIESEKVASNSKIISKQGRSLKVDLREFRDPHCEISIPAEIALKTRGESGTIILTRPMAPVNIVLKNGIVDIEPNSSVQYKYDLKVINGRIEGLESSTDKNAIPVSITVSNGSIRNSSDSADD